MEFDSNGYQRTHRQYKICVTNDRSTESSLHLGGTWSTDVGLRISTANERLFLKSFTDFGGRKLIVATLQVSEYYNAKLNIYYCRLGHF